MPRIDAVNSRELFAAARVIRLATVGSDGQPHLVPVTTAMIDETVVFAVDFKPKHTTRLQRLANIAANPRVALLADHYDEDWNALWWVRADAVAAEVSGAEREEALDQLAAKYQQYRDRRPEGAVVAARVVRWTGWRATRPEPPAPEPDTKDWTWTIEKACPNCGFDPSAVRREDFAELLTRVAARWPVVLDRPGAARRPAPGTWSPLEYGCHVRDVYRIFADRARLMLTADEPRFANWDQDETAIESRYWQADPTQVATEIAAAAAPAAAAFTGLSPDQWARKGFRSNGSEFTVQTLGSYLLHDLVHHCWDVGAELDTQ